MFGRRRLVPEIDEPQRRRCARPPSAMTVNMPIQGTAADILKRAMIDAARRLCAARIAGRRRRAG